MMIYSLLYGFYAQFHIQKEGPGEPSSVN